HLIAELAAAYGSQCIVAAIDTGTEAGEWLVYLNGGRTRTQTVCIDWAREVVKRGAGEILLTSMNHDGTKQGFAVELTRSVSTSVHVPVIASGGGGTMEHFAEVFDVGNADAALAASVFHFGEIPIPKLKEYLRERNIAVRV
ncbi:MAG TPA: HisA/HisF-related TIM barrel protein, partial [Chitinophagaceae bacterium]